VLQDGGLALEKAGLPSGSGTLDLEGCELTDRIRIGLVEATHLVQLRILQPLHALHDLEAGDLVAGGEGRVDALGARISLRDQEAGAHEPLQQRVRLLQSLLGIDLARQAVAQDGLDDGARRFELADERRGLGVHDARGLARAGAGDGVVPLLAAELGAQLLRQLGDGDQENVGGKEQGIRDGHSEIS